MPSTRKKSVRRPSRRVSRKKAAPAAAAPSETGSGLAPEMQAVNTYLAVANVKASIDFLERAFGFTRGVVLPGVDGQPRYAEMRHGDSVVMLIPKGDGTSATGGAAALYTYVGDVDKALTKARAAGAGVSEAEDRPWGDRTATITDPDGYRWVLATFKKLVPFS
jgi:PhnB protein